jgi:hypothetical protein
MVETKKRCFVFGVDGNSTWKRNRARKMKIVEKINSAR